MSGAGKPVESPPAAVEQTLKAGGNPYSAPVSAFGRYEFNDHENRIIGHTSDRLRAWGIVSMAIGSLNVLVGCLALARPVLAANLFSGLVSIVVGASFYRAASALGRVVTTQGNDLSHMMSALKRVSAALTVQIVTTVVGFFLAMGAVVLVLAGRVTP